MLNDSGRTEETDDPLSAAAGFMLAVVCGACLWLVLALALAPWV